MTSYVEGYLPTYGDAYETAYAEAVEAEVVRVARYQTEEAAS